MKWDHMYLSSISNDILNIPLAVHKLRRVRAFPTDFREARNFKREALRVHDVPVERIDLREEEIIGELLTIPQVTN